MIPLLTRWFETLIRILTGMNSEPAVIYSSPVLAEPHETLNAAAVLRRAGMNETVLKFLIKLLTDQRVDTGFDRALHSVYSPREMVLS
ncbi:MAG: hypothetical protein V1929_05685 [bacterium]